MNYVSSPLKFKMAPVGDHPKEDEDINTCPARTRLFWPKKIVPWWTPHNKDDKPPFSYATLIAYAILSSKDGRLTLNGIYTWISHQYPFYSMRQGGWQNSIRHNLSLNKKWFFKIDRRPTQTNPGKGCYWTLIPGAESVFINKLTYEKSHYRKHHDIELTAELFKDQHRGTCYHHATNAAPTGRSISSPLTTSFHGSSIVTPPSQKIPKPDAEDSDNDSSMQYFNDLVVTSTTSTCSLFLSDYLGIGLEQIYESYKEPFVFHSVPSDPLQSIF